MGNTNSGSNSPSLNSRWGTGGQDPSSKEIHIQTDRADGFYFTGEYLTGSIEVPSSYVQQYFNGKTSRKGSESSSRRSMNTVFFVDLVGDATYSAEVDAAADSDGHATHQVNLCRQRCLVTLQSDQDRSTQSESATPVDQTLNLPADNNSSTSVRGTFQLEVPDGLPPSLMTNRPPSVIYNLELNLSSSRYRYQIPITISSKGSIPNQIANPTNLSSSAMNQHEIYLQANTFREFYRAGEQIPVRVSYTNPQQRSIRSITVTLHQFYRVHNDLYRSQLDGKEWNFDVNNIGSSGAREWIGETLLQLPNQGLAASYKSNSVGTTQLIECELDYRIVIELNERKGDDIQLTLPSVQVSYQTA